MGLVGLPYSLFQYWLMLRPKKDDPFPKGGLIRLLIAGAVAVVLSVLLSIPINFITAFAQLVSPELIASLQNGTAAIVEAIQNASANAEPSFLFNLFSMFFGAGLLEEGLKYALCRRAIRKEGMVRTWMDAVIAFAVVGITFELIENVAFGMDSELIQAFMRGIAAAHFAFGTIMGYFYGKYLVTGEKKYRRLSLVLPIAYHTITNALMSSMEINAFFSVVGMIAAISLIVAGVVALIVVARWQKNGTLDVPVQQG